MPRKRKSAPLEQTIVWAPDRPIGAHLCRRLADCKMAHREPGGVDKVRAAVRSARPRSLALLMAAAPRQGRAQLQLVSELFEMQVPVFVWGSGRQSTEGGQRDDWILDRLLEQAGALVAEELPMLLEALRITHFAGRPLPGPIRVGGRAGELKRRLVAALTGRRVRFSPGRRTGASWWISAGSNGELRLEAGRRGRGLLLTDPHRVAGALALLSRYGGPEPEVADSPEPKSQREVDLIARPPARLLSEVTSKRLAACFGLASGAERLCRSASEAVRFAAEFNGPLVFKAVIPGLLHKREAGLIHMDVLGPAAVRRAFFALEKKGAPGSVSKSLGVLAARQVTGGLRFWVQMLDHGKFGRIVRGGLGDRVTGRPIFALQTPCTMDRILKALLDSGQVPDNDLTAKIARGIGCFSKMVHTLGPRISRAQIDPLVALVEQEEALVLDALVAITDIRGK